MFKIGLDDAKITLSKIGNSFIDEIGYLFKWK